MQAEGLLPRPPVGAPLGPEVCLCTHPAGSHPWIPEVPYQLPGLVWKSLRGSLQLPHRGAAILQTHHLSAASKHQDRGQVRVGEHPPAPHKVSGQHLCKGSLSP